eukprot:755020-Hanusia_phi.AAC.1
MKRALRGLPPVSSLPLAAGAEGSKSSGEQEASSAGYLDEIDHLVSEIFSRSPPSSISVAQALQPFPFSSAPPFLALSLR